MEIDNKPLYDLLQWAIGNRGSKSSNPYSVPEVKAVLKAIAVERKFHSPNTNYFDALDGWEV